MSYLLLRQELALQDLSRLLGVIFGNGRQGAAQSAALVFECWVLCVESLEILQALERGEVLVWKECSLACVSSDVQLVPCSG